MRSRFPRSHLALVLAGLVGAVGCARGRRVTPTAGAAPDRREAGIAGTLDVAGLYQRAGFLAEGAPIPFVGSVHFLAGPTPDTTLVLVALSMANRALTFVRDGEQYRAGYAIALDVRQGSATVRHAESHQVVRVAAYKETTRSDESIIFQQFLPVPPGQHVLALSLRDDQSAKSASQEQLLLVPRLGPGTLASPVPVFQVRPRSRVDSLPALITNPRSTVTFGRDSVLPLYFEAYGAEPRTVLQLAARGERGEALWSDSLVLVRTGSLLAGTARVPAGPLGVGIASVVAWRRGAADSVRTAVLVSFGDNIAIASFDEMLSYLRYFTSAERLRALRDTAPERRSAAWAAFLRETDPVLSTPEHEGLREYFARIEQANDRFREEGIAGWLTDRGMVYVSLGEPDRVLEQGVTDLSQRGRTMVWEYLQYRLQLIFVDQTGFGRWKLTVGSEADFRDVVRRLQTH